MQTVHDGDIFLNAIIPNEFEYIVDDDARKYWDDIVDEVKRDLKPVLREALLKHIVWIETQFK